MQSNFIPAESQQGKCYIEKTFLWEPGNASGIAAWLNELEKTYSLVGIENAIPISGGAVVIVWVDPIKKKAIDGGVTT